MCTNIEEKCKTLQDGNLTSVLSGPDWYLRSEAKCAHILKAVLLLSVHSSQVLLSGYLKSTANDRLAYVAHNRYTNKHCSREHVSVGNTSYSSNQECMMMSFLSAIKMTSSCALAAT